MKLGHRERGSRRPVVHRDEQMSPKTWPAVDEGSCPLRFAVGVGAEGRTKCLHYSRPRAKDAPSRAGNAVRLGCEDRAEGCLLWCRGTD
jgi:hypothetical protein